jgi:phage major head subunit gpT-like protein
VDYNETAAANLFKTFSLAFQQGMQRGRALPPEMQAERIKLAEIAMIIRSGSASTIHAWLNQIPGYRRWVGDRQKKNAATNAIDVVNADFEATITIPVNSVKDDQYGLYTPLLENLGAEGGDEALWLDIVIDALLANGKWADAAAFFGTVRKYGNNTIANLATGALTATTFETGVLTMESYKGHNDIPLGVLPMYLLVGPSLRSTAWDLVKNQFVSSGTGKGGAIENRCRGRALLRTHPKLTGSYANYWFLLGEKGGMKGCVCQKRQEAELVRKDQPGDDNVFFEKEIVYGGDARGEAFLGMPHLIYSSTGAA